MLPAIKPSRRAGLTALGTWLLLALAQPTAAELVLSDPDSDVYDRFVIAGGSIYIEVEGEVTGNPHGNDSVVLKRNVVVTGDVSAVDTVRNLGTVHGTITQGAPPVPLPALLDEPAMRALASRAFEQDTVFTDAVIDDVVFVDGAVEVVGRLEGVGTILATGDVRLRASTAVLGEETRISIVSLRDVALGKDRRFRGVLRAARDVTFEQGVDFAGVIVAERKVLVKKEGRVGFLDFAIDPTPPIINAVLSPLANAAGWHNTAVTVTFHCEDTGSGVASCSDPVVVEVEGADQVVTGTAVDRAGNTSDISLSVNVDQRLPIVLPAKSPPPNENDWHATDVEVRFECLDFTSGIATCSDLVRVTQEGAAQAIVGTATDLAGNSATASVEVNLDKTAPTIVIQTPENGSRSRSPDVHVSGVVADANAVTAAACNSAAVGLQEDAFACDLVLPEGMQTIRVDAIDVAGNLGSASVEVELKLKPRVRITQPDAPVVVRGDTIDVVGTVDEEDVSVEVRGVAATVTPSAEGAVFTATGVALEEGNNLLTATATNSLGNVGTGTTRITRDTSAPRVTIGWPPDGFVTTSQTISVAGIVNDVVAGTVGGGEVAVAVGGVAARVDNRGYLASGVALTPGLNTITAIANDRAGNASVPAMATVRYDPVSQQPRIEIVSGNDQQGVITEPLSEPLVVRLVDSAGEPVAEQVVLFKVVANDGTLGDGATARALLAVTTDSQGLASARWTLGRRAGAGNNVVEASAVGFGVPAVFTAVAARGAPAKIVIDTGNDQTGVAGEPLPLPFVAVVVDGGNNRVAGVPVTFNVRAGGGSLEGDETLTVVSDSDGRALATLTLGSAEGADNNFVSASFEGNEGTVAGFRASGRIPQISGVTRLSGVVLDNTDVPIAGVTLHVAGTPLVAQSDAQGQFSLAPVPVGTVLLQVEGATADRPGVWPHLDFELVTVSGIDNRLRRPVYLLPIDEARGLFVDETTGGVLSLPEVPGFSLSVAPGSVTFPGGGKSGVVSVTLVHADKVPMMPGFGQQPRFIITIQPAGALFEPPAPISYPNVDGLAPRQVTELYSFDHDLGQFVAIGTASVSADGSRLVSDPGVGILEAGWHCGGDPSRGICLHRCPECQFCMDPPCECRPDDMKEPTSITDIPGDCREPDCKNGKAVQAPKPADRPVPEEARDNYCKKCDSQGNVVADESREWDRVPGTECSSCKADGEAWDDNYVRGPTGDELEEACDYCEGMICVDGKCELRGDPACDAMCSPDMCGTPCDCMGGTAGLVTSPIACWAVKYTDPSAPDGARYICFRDYGTEDKPPQNFFPCCGGGCGLRPTGDDWSINAAPYRCTVAEPCTFETARLCAKPVNFNPNP